MQKSVRENSPRRENPIANQLYCSLIPFFTWKKTFFSGQSTIHVNFTFSTGSKVTWCIWFGETTGNKIESKTREIYHLNDIIIVKKRFTFCGFMNYLWTQWELKHIGKVRDEEISFFCFLFSLFPLHRLEAFLFAFQWKQIRQTIKRELSSVRHKRECRREIPRRDSHENSFLVSWFEEKDRRFRARMTWQFQSLHNDNDNQIKWDYKARKSSFVMMVLKWY